MLDGHGFIGNILYLSTDNGANAMPMLKHLSLMTLLEGASLIALVLVAVPLKHMADMPAAVSAIGPVHGVFYLWTMAILGVVLFRRQLSGTDGTVVALAALIPFGGVFSHRLIRRRLATADAPR